MKKLFILPIALGLLLVSFNTSNFVGMIRHDVDIEKYREIGRQSDYECVGRYSTSELETDYATGILVSSKWVLTAAHFVADSSVWKFGENFYHTRRIVKHPKFATLTQEAQFDGWDMALVELEKPVLDVKPAVRYRGNKELGRTITKLGYGLLGNGHEGMAKSRVQEKLGGQNVIDAIGGIFEDREFSNSVMVCDFDDPENSELNQFGSPIPLELEISGSKGDSGGGIFMDESGTTVLVGTISGALSRQIKYGAVLSMTRVSHANGWIDSVIY